MSNNNNDIIDRKLLKQYIFLIFQIIFFEKIKIIIFK